MEPPASVQRVVSVTTVVGLARPGAPPPRRTFTVVDAADGATRLV